MIQKCLKQSLAKIDFSGASLVAGKKDLTPKQTPRRGDSKLKVEPQPTSESKESPPKNRKQHNRKQSRRQRTPSSESSNHQQNGRDNRVLQQESDGTMRSQSPGRRQKPIISVNKASKKQPVTVPTVEPFDIQPTSNDDFKPPSSDSLNQPSIQIDYTNDQPD